MINRLRTRFIIASMLSLALVLLIILGGINLMSYRKITHEADIILKVLTDNGGHFPPKSELLPEQRINIRNGMPAAGDSFGRNGLSPETPYESRFFSVVYDFDGNVTETDTRMVSAVDRETAVQCGEHVLASGREKGFWGDYRFCVNPAEGSTRIIFLDCSRSLAHIRSTILTSLLIAFGGLAAVLVLLMLFSAKIVRPVAESYEKQKQFITDAGHEIKTPLTVIGADLELAEMECGENEWLSDIRTQITRLTGLTNDLIALSRMDEERPLEHAVEFPLSDLVEETARSFAGPAAGLEKKLLISVQPLLSMEGVENDLRKLVSILIDNALKYSPKGGIISVSLEKNGRNHVLCVSNPISEVISREQLSLMFDRFYRADPARSSVIGYRLGLSIAAGIVRAHKGSIQASGGTDELTVSVVLPSKH